MENLLRGIPLICLVLAHVHELLCDVIEIVPESGEGFRAKAGMGEVLVHKATEEATRVVKSVRPNRQISCFTWSTGRECCEDRRDQ